jgi:hypothetical protein
MKSRVLYPVVAFVLVFIAHAFYAVWGKMQIYKQWIQIDNTTLLNSYFKNQDYFLSLSYALLGSFIIYSFLKCFEYRKCSIGGMLSGVTLTSVLYFGGCFLLGCCGSPIFAVYLGLFGVSFLGLTKPILFIFTVTSVVIGYLWMEKKTKTLEDCCER